MSEVTSNDFQAMLTFRPPFVVLSTPSTLKLSSLLVEFDVEIEVMLSAETDAPATSCFRAADKVEAAAEALEPARDSWYDGSWTVVKF